MACKLCEKRGKPEHFEDEPKCAFNDVGVFRVDNWQCATLGELRKIALENDWDERMADIEVTVARIPLKRKGDTLRMAWYKSRGQTENASIIEYIGKRTRERVLRLDDAERVLMDYGTYIKEEDMKEESTSPMDELIEIGVFEATGIIQDRRPFGKYWLRDMNEKNKERYVAIDNSTGDAWTEEFDDYKTMAAWLRREIYQSPTWKGR